MKKNSVLFKLFKGFIYGNVFGLIFGVAIYLLASAVAVIAAATGGALPITPTMFLILIYGASVVSGTAVEYSRWLDNLEE